MSKKLKVSEVWGEKVIRVSLCESCQAANDLFCKFKTMNADRAMIVQSCPKYRRVKDGN